jgi:hypothetical protein
MVLAACQSSRAVGVTPTLQEAQQQPKGAEQEGTEVAEILATEVVIVYTRSGGLAGAQETYEIHTDGRIVHTDDGNVNELQVTAEQVEALLAELDDLGFFEAATSKPSGPSNLGADRTTSTLTVHRGEKPLSMTMVDGAPDQPPELIEAVRAVSDLIASASE